MAVAIKHKPNKTVSGLGAPTRGSNNRKMTATWKVPSSMTSDKSDSRAEHLEVIWKFNIGGKTKKLEKEVGVNKTESTVNLSSLKIGSKTYTRNSFYPNTSKNLTSVTIAVKGKNSKGKGESATQTRKFEKPRKPEIDPITFNTSNGHCVTTVKTNAGTDYHERYDTMYRVTVTDRNGNVSNPSTGVTVTSGQSTYTDAQRALTSTEFTVEYDVSGYQSLTRDQHIKVTVEAWARGYAGDSKITTREYYVSKPKQATITGKSVSSDDSQDGILTVYIDTNKTTEHPVDTVKLEYLANTTYTDASSIPPTGWADSGIEDNGDCTALAIPLSIDNNFIPDRGKTTWIRVKTFHANEAILYSYSEYRNIDELETAAAIAVEDVIEILNAEAGENGKSAVVLLGWNKSGTDDSVGTELSWSKEEDTWRSTEDPSKHDFAWTDGEITYGGETYHDSATITIKGLDEGEKYYIYARRYYEGEATTYGQYSNQATVITNEKPLAVVASCGKYLIAGDPLPIYWTYSGNALQTNWRIEMQSSGASIDGEGAATSTRISWDRVEPLIENNSLTFRVWVSTGSNEKESEWHTVLVRERPTLSISSSSVMTSQPYSFTATSNKLCDLITIVTSQGASGQYPQGYLIQTSGDTIHSDVYSPEWSNSSATITLPDELDFWDLGSYTLSVAAVDRETGLKSEEVIKDFEVDWSHKAPDPDEFVSLMPLDYMNDNNEHIQSVQITLTPPTGSASTDVYDIYRMDGGKAYLIGEDYPLTATVEDVYAPFSVDDDLYYRIALKTADGSVEFADKKYVLESETVRFDWSGGSLELPYGITIGDSYSKDVEFRQHMDGTADGYWNRNIERKGQYNSSIIKLIQPEEISLARQLARYAGAVFVRTANGSAFTADVQVTDLSVKNKAVTAVAFDATEVELTEEFMLPSPYELEDE